MNPQKVVIIGAPRSGTNMLRDLLVTLHQVGTWPCDEINYIWRHGNVYYPSDEFTREMATPKVKQYIRNQFDRLAKSYQLDVVVEKTCANSLRVGFVDEVLPDAKYIFIVRDGVDVIASAMLRWKAKLDIPYILRKTRYVPVADLAYYASHYLANRVYRLVSKDKRLAFWGPRMKDMDSLLSQYSLQQICALQWKACVNNSEHELGKISSSRVLRVTYENFILNPKVEFLRIAEFMGRNIPENILERICEKVSVTSIGKGRASMTPVELNNILPLIKEELVCYGYDR